MPYIRGRYYMNPVVGDALEAAREAEAALQALEHAAKVARGDTGEEDAAGAGSPGANGGSIASGSGANSNSDSYAKSAPGPIHRVEIEASSWSPPTQDAPSAASSPASIAAQTATRIRRRRQARKTTRPRPPRSSRATPSQTHHAQARSTLPPKPTSSPITTT